MTRVRKKEYIDKSVYEEALERIRFAYRRFDKVVVSFSGGKDSTAVFNCALTVAKELGRLPLDVVFFDEEAIHPPTIDYVRRVANNPDVNLFWYCLEFKHRNACSNEEPFWYTWEKGKEDVWVRPMPDEGITEHPKFVKGMTFQEFCPYLYERSAGSVAMLTGIRTQESLRRYQVIAKKKNEAFINAVSERGQNQYRVFPIYDWSSEDVWLAVKKLGWDYNKTYDIYNQTALYENYLHQRVCPPFGEEPLRGLWLYAECFPEMWHKMLYRVKGVSTAWRYGNSELYISSKAKPEDVSWKDYIDVVIASYDTVYQNMIKNSINRYIKTHYKKSKMPITEDVPDCLSGISWKWLCTVAIRGDFKGRQSSATNPNAVAQREKMGISLEEAIRLYGTKEMLKTLLKSQQ